ncbi:MAG: fibronectin type III domain-containing protein [Betaproteobacteria bacterium]|nr:MAG: fibronectin type III domain-containing protein [Betaproteobacteria bacterium]
MKKLYLILILFITGYGTGAAGQGSGMAEQEELRTMEVNVAWTAPIDEILRYEISWTTYGVEQWIDVDVEIPNTQTFRNSGLFDLDEFEEGGSYRVRAVDTKLRPSDWSEFATALWPSRIKQMGKPTTETTILIDGEKVKVTKRRRRFGHKRGRWG